MRGGYGWGLGLARAPVRTRRKARPVRVPQRLLPKGWGVRGGVVEGVGACEGV